MTGTILVESPEGLAAETLAASVLLCLAAIIAVGLRVWARISISAFGGDDYLVLIALAFFIPCCIFVNIGCLSGLGMTDDAIEELDPSGVMAMNGFKWFVFFWLTYLLCLPFIKISICVALLRITQAKRYVFPLRFVMLLSVASSVIGISGLLNQCQPLSGTWDKSQGVCKSEDRVGRLTLVTSGISILSDCMCAVIPTFILWNLNMRARTKVSLALILALGGLASISTCIRLPRLIAFYSDEEKDKLHKAAHIVVWSVVECGIGIIAGSLPPLRPLCRRFGIGFGTTRRLKLSDEAQNPAKRDASDAGPYGHTATINDKPIRLGTLKRADRGKSLTTTCQGGGQHSTWDHRTIDDVDIATQKLIIVKNTQIDVEYEAADPAQWPRDEVVQKPLKVRSYTT